MKSVVVQKYGGSSMADAERIERVASRVAETRSRGCGVVVVVSAMGHTTDELLAMARRIAPNPSRRELDMLLSAGERISMALLSLALNARDVPAISFTGSQSGIITNDAHTNARIVEVRPFRIQDELDRDRVVIVAGYQGVSYKREITTLGRGGSDTTAVALAAALDAEACEIYSDVDGVYSADPREVPAARRLDEISYEEMQELAAAGARVLNAQAVEFAKAKGIAIYARATSDGEGETLVRRFPPEALARVAGIASQRGLALVSLPSGDARELAGMLAALDAAGLPGRELTYRDAGEARPSVVVSLENVHDLGAVRARLGPDLTWREGIGAVSAVGSGITADFEVTRRIIETLGAAGIEPIGLATSSFRVSVLMADAQVEAAARRLHAALVERSPSSR
jgi:aspartate kinase